MRITVTYNPFPITTYDLDNIKQLKLDNNNPAALMQYLGANRAQVFDDIKAARGNDSSSQKRP